MGKTGTIKAHRLSIVLYLLTYLLTSNNLVQWNDNQAFCSSWWIKVTQKSETPYTRRSCHSQHHFKWEPVRCTALHISFIGYMQSLYHKTVVSLAERKFVPCGKLGDDDECIWYCITHQWCQCHVTECFFFHKSKLNCCKAVLCVVDIAD